MWFAPILPLLFTLSLERPALASIGEICEVLNTPFDTRDISRDELVRLYKKLIFEISPRILPDSAVEWMMKERARVFSLPPGLPSGSSSLRAALALFGERFEAITPESARDAGYQELKSLLSNLLSARKTAGDVRQDIARRLQATHPWIREHLDTDRQFLSPQGDYYAFLRSDRVSLWSFDSDQPKVEILLNGRDVNAFTISEDGRKIAAGFVNGESKVWDTGSGRLSWHDPGRSNGSNASSVAQMRFDETGNGLLVAETSQAKGLLMTAGLDRVGLLLRFDISTGVPGNPSTDVIGMSKFPQRLLSFSSDSAGEEFSFITADKYIVKFKTSAEGSLEQKILKHQYPANFVQAEHVSPSLSYFFGISPYSMVYEFHRVSQSGFSSTQLYNFANLTGISLLALSNGEPPPVAFSRVHREDLFLIRGPRGSTRLTLRKPERRIPQRSSVWRLLIISLLSWRSHRTAST
jgi:hypothetical protein